MNFRRLLCSALMVALSASLSFAATERPAQVIALNQVGYLTDAPKRFTVPLASDATRFVVRAKDGKEALFTGEIQKNIGDFSGFRPKDSASEYVIALEGSDGSAVV